VTSPATNTVTLAGGGSLALTAQDVTTILLLTQTISFAPLTTQVLGEQPFTLSASASSGLAVTLMSTAPGVCQLSGSTVSLLGLGTCGIQASQSGNGTYAAAKSVSQSFLVVSACDLTMSGGTSLSDVQQIVNEALGVAAPANNLSASGTVNVLDIQIEIDAALRLGCAAK
jgi:hypothetical protein